MTEEAKPRPWRLGPAAPGRWHGRVARNPMHQARSRWPTGRERLVASARSQKPDALLAIPVPDQAAGQRSRLVV